MISEWMVAEALGSELTDAQIKAEPGSGTEMATKRLEPTSWGL